MVKINFSKIVERRDQVDYSEKLMKYAIGEVENVT